MNKLNENFAISGEEIANMIGCGDVYRKSKQHETEMIQEQKKIKNEFNEMLNRINNAKL